MPTFPSVSIILSAKHGEADAKIWHSVRTLGKSEWRAEVLIVEDPSNADLQERITYRPFPQRFQRVDEAIAAASHPLVALVESPIEIDVDQWNFMAKRMDVSPVQTTYQQQGFWHRNQLNRFQRMLIWVYNVFVRMFLRIGKTELHPGITLFDRKQFQSVLDDFQSSCDASTPTSFGLATTQMLALARLHGLPVLETKIGGPKFENSTPGPPDPQVKSSSTKNIMGSIQNAMRFWWNKLMFPRRHQDLQQKRFKPLEKLGAVAVLAMLAAFVLFGNLGFPLFEPDEARNAQLAINIVESGQWMSLSLAEEYYWDKPPLQIWAIAASYKLFGISQFSTRLPIALAALTTILLTLLIGKRLVGFRAAWLGALLLLLTSGFVCAGRYVTMDASLTATATAMLLFGFVAINQKFKKRYAIAAGFACGVGILVKGPVIGVLCFPPLLATYWLASPSQRRAISAQSLLWFLVPAFLIGAPWYLATAIIHPDFLTYFFWKHHVVRFSAAFNHREPFWYYMVGIFIFMFPASYLIPSVARFLTSRKPENRLLRTREHGFLFLSAIWIIAFFSISESKLPTYIIPSFPPICLLMGVLLDRKLFSQGKFSPNLQSAHHVATPITWLEKTGRRAPFEMLFWFAVTGLAILVFFKTESASAVGLIGCTIVLLILVVMATRFRTKPKIAWACSGIIAIFMMSLTAHQLIPALSINRSIHSAANQLQSTDEYRDAQVVFFGRESYGASMKLDQSRIHYFDGTDVQSMVEFLNVNPTSIIVSSEGPMEVLRRDLPWTISLDECETGRHLYLSSPNPTVMASRQESKLIR